ncbi:MAG: VanZ family protein [Peptostreptococcaceae bacterium]|nr:VanZ family protein [Peptostreptococcaceae bacterium]
MPDKRSKIILPILCILWICFIFFMSSDVNSSERSITISETISEEVQGTEITDENSLKQIDLLIRKGSHFFEYLVLSLLLLKTSEVYGMKLKQSAGYVLFICLLIANLDEFYQSFVPGRNSLVRDSLIDFGGAFTGMLIYAGMRLTFPYN